MSTQTKWALDPTHSEVGFKIKHLMITNVSGSFGSFTADAITDGDDFNTAQINFSADISSINTGNEQRDTHLKSPDFFEAEKFAHLTFKGNGLTPTDEAGEFELKGDLTIRDVTKPIKLKVEMGGIAKDPWGQTKAGFTIAGKINRKDFGLVWNAPTEAGGLLVSEEVRLNAEIQLVKLA